MVTSGPVCAARGLVCAGTDSPRLPQVRCLHPCLFKEPEWADTRELLSWETWDSAARCLLPSQALSQHPGISSVEDRGQPCSIGLTGVCTASAVQRVRGLATLTGDVGWGRTALLSCFFALFSARSCSKLRKCRGCGDCAWRPVVQASVLGFVRLGESAEQVFQSPWECRVSGKLPHQMR